MTLSKVACSIIGCALSFKTASAVALKSVAKSESTDIPQVGHFCDGVRCRMPEDYLWYVHISKVMGTTMCALASHYERLDTENNCNGDEESYQTYSHAGDNSNDVRKIGMYLRKKGYSAIFTESDHPYGLFESAIQGGGAVPVKNNGNGILFFTITRDPVDRLLSQYYQDHGYVAPARGEFAQSVLNNSDNIMTRWFLPKGEHRSPITEDDFNEAMHYLKAFVLILPMESVSRSIPIMRERLGWSRLTQIAHKGYGTLRNTNAVAELSQEEYVQVMKHAKWDLRIHQAIKEKFAHDFGEGYDAPSAARVSKEEYDRSQGEGSLLEGVGKTICGFSNGQLRCPGHQYSFE